MQNNQQSDHDLLIRIDTKLGLLIDQFHTHKEMALKEIAVLNEVKMDKVEVSALRRHADKIHEDHETRLRRIEKFGAISMGVIMAIQAFLGFKIF